MPEELTMTNSIDQKATVLGLFYDKDGVLCQKLRKDNGEISVVPVPGAPDIAHEPESAKDFIETDFDKRFNDTTTVPHDLVPAKTSPLVNKAVAKEISKLTETYNKNGTDDNVIQQTLTQFIDIIFAEHALLIRIIGSPESLAAREEPLDLKNSALFEAVQLQIDILKGPWLDVRHKIKSSK